MKTTLVTTICSLALAWTALGQTPAASPLSTLPPTITPAVAPQISATPDDENALERKIEAKVKRHFQISFGDDSKHERRHHESNSDSDAEWMAVPIVGIIFATLFGAPVLVVGLIMFFSYWRARSLHRTVRTMVEKGQEVPPALFLGPAPVIRARSDMRRGVVLVMVGIGLMVFFGAVNDWDGGAWAIGIIPFLIGAGYLLVWKLETPQRNAFNTSTDNTPRVP